MVHLLLYPNYLLITSFHDLSMTSLIQPSVHHSVVLDPGKKNIKHPKHLPFLVLTTSNKRQI